MYTCAMLLCCTHQLVSTHQLVIYIRGFEFGWDSLSLAICKAWGMGEWGIVPSSVVLTSFQVMSRVFLIWAVTHSVKEVQSEDSVLLFVIAWTITEIIRYSFYTFSLLNHLPYLIKWARYTLFIVLYPMGVSGELLTIYAALPFVRQAGLYSISLPNKYNFSFDYHAFLILIMISYIPIFPQLYFHMIHQRRKILSHTEEHKKFE
ncbi:very-long-chain (3R)-3-hydroxyacyl-CoA dehydratase 2 isoform X4 [Chlorocebus sabaeus]|uniref:very-long-chain (3R)-3-hydroxyacyl-CoA dehydratase 2 isoform X4 n=1 Tax=Chlorocebus sabaeus TaxID=60711 RepID=UPI003BF9C4A7